MLCGDWPRGSGEEDEEDGGKKFKWFWRNRWKCDKYTKKMLPLPTDKLWSEKLTWAYGSGELKSIIHQKFSTIKHV